MPKRDPLDDWSTFRRASLDDVPDGGSATHREPAETPIRDEQRRLVASVVAEIWDDFDDLEQAVYVLRFEARPAWTHEKIARAVSLTRRAVGYCEQRIYAKIRMRVFPK